MSFLVGDFVPDGVVEFYFPCFVSGAVAAGVLFFEFDFADFVVHTAVFVVPSEYGMTVFYAVLEYPDIRLAVFADAGYDKVCVGDLTDARCLVFFIPSLLRNSKYYFFHLVHTSELFFCLFGRGATAPVEIDKKNIDRKVLRKSTTKKKLLLMNI